MPNKIKLFFSFLALIALFSIYNVFNSFSGKTSNFIANNTTETLSFVIDGDVDKDGLTNREESYWNTDFQNPDTDGDGFLDGEEVASGHDPLIKGPHDLFAQANNTENLTEKLAALITSGLYSGDLKPEASDQVYNKAIDDLSLATIYEGFTALTPEEIRNNEIKIGSDTKQEKERYFNQMILIFETNILEELVAEPFEVSRLVRTTDITDPKKNEEVRVYFLSKSAHIKQVLAKLDKIEVPPTLIDTHKDIISFLRTLNLNYNSIGMVTEDPLKALVALSHLQETYLSSQSILASIANQVKKGNFKIESKNFLLLIQNLYDI